MVHGMILRDDNYCVAVEVAFIKDAPLLIPNEDISTTLVNHIVGSFIAWPKSLVLFDNMMVINYLSVYFV